MPPARLTCALLVTAALASARACRGRAEPEKWTPDWAFKVKRVTSVARLARRLPRGLRGRHARRWRARRASGCPRCTSRARDGSGAFQLTRGDKSATAPDWSPDGRHIAFLSGRGPKKDGKDPKPALWRVAVDGGEAEALTDEKGAVTAFRFSPDGASHRVPDGRSAHRRGREGGQGEARRPRGGRRAEADPPLRPPPGEGRGREAPGAQADGGDLSVGNIGGPGRLRLVAGRPHDRVRASAHAAHQRLAVRRPVRGRSGHRQRAPGGRDARVGDRPRLLARRPLDRLQPERRPADLARPREGGRGRRDRRRAARAGARPATSSRTWWGGRATAACWSRSEPHGEPAVRGGGGRRERRRAGAGRPDGGRRRPERGRHACRLHLAGGRPGAGGLRERAGPLRAGAGEPRPGPARRFRWDGPRRSPGRRRTAARSKGC